MPSQWSAAFDTIRSTGPSGTHRATSASDQETGDGVAAARASISAEESTPVTVAAGQRAAQARASAPAPQPRSTIRPGVSAATAASRSLAGRSRSPPKRA